MGFAEYLGFDMNAHPDLYWIAEQARNAPLPEPWIEHTDEGGNSYYYNEQLNESSWEHPLDSYFKGLYDRHKAAPAGSLAAPPPPGANRPAMRYGGSSSTSALLHRQQGQGGSGDSLGAGLPPKASTVTGLGSASAGQGVDMSLVQRMEEERRRAMSEGRLPAGASMPALRYEGSQSESVLSNAMRQATLGPANTAGAAAGPKGLTPTGMTGMLMMDEGALLGYGSNGTMVFKGTWNGEQVAVKRMHIIISIGHARNNM